jgi:hypothetical protein
VIEGIASVNEAAITGESAPVIRESGGDRSAVTGGTQVLSDWIKVKQRPASKFKHLRCRDLTFRAFGDKGLFRKVSKELPARRWRACCAGGRLKHAEQA